MRFPYNTIKDAHRYAVQVIRRGGNDDAHCFLARTTITNTQPATGNKQHAV